MRQLTVNKNDAGQRFDKFLAKYMDMAPKSFFYKMLRKKNIVLNGKKAEGSEKLVEKDLITLYLSDETIDKFKSNKEIIEVECNFSVLYEDEHILVIDKPVGVLSQRADKTDISLNEMIKSYLISEKRMTKEDMDRFTPAVCNRLDRNTSGIVMAGKSLLGLQELTRMFREREIEKYYYSIVLGQMTMKKSISAFLVKETEKNIVTVITEEESKSPVYQNLECVKIEAEYEPVKVYEQYTLLKIKLITGKTHQIRAHLAYLGHPVIGDYKYGSRNTNQIFKKKYGLDYQLLHAGIIRIPQITGGVSYLSKQEFEAPIPELFQKILSDIDKGDVNAGI